MVGEKSKGSDGPCNCTRGARSSHPSLQELVKTPFFRYFKVKLWCDCPFWPDDGMCRLRDCSVCECPDNEFPESFKKPNHGLPLDDLICQEGKPEAAVDRTLDSKAFRGWTEIDNPWTNDDETDNAEMTYVNLQLNPERYTGYTVNLPEGYGMLSTQRTAPNIHLKIHIASDYLLDETTQTWGQNLSLMYDRVLRYPDRVRNLYFTYLFVLRAVTKVSLNMSAFQSITLCLLGGILNVLTIFYTLGNLVLPDIAYLAGMLIRAWSNVFRADYLEHAEYDTGNPIEDLKTQSLTRQLLYNPKLQAACPIPFDEAKLWKGQSGPELKPKIQKQFRNISALMDCVGCEKCRLWGKLQVLGLGTALKILFSVDGQPNAHQNLQLQRNEVIALMNLLSRLSESVKFVNEMGPSAEIEAQVSAPTSPSCPLQRMWASMLNRPAPNCPLQRMWKSISDRPPPSCPLQRIWASING
ncbi:hypothetical protein M0R45_013644 [Rubus argutus]|uniref:Uncharacterized protein n=1 Tax=Rubus argutus TaxID=59490 RepID=A0AAW1XKM5_RUBAR